MASGKFLSTPMIKKKIIRMIPYSVYKIYSYIFVGYLIFGKRAYIKIR